MKTRTTLEQKPYVMWALASLMALVLNCKPDDDNSLSPEEPSCQLKTAVSSSNGEPAVVSTAEYNAQNLVTSIVTSTTGTAGSKVVEKETYTYDNNGYLLSYKDVSNPGTAQERTGFEVTYKYSNGRLTEAKYINIYTLTLDTEVTQDTSLSTSSYVYDAAGKISAYTDATDYGTYSYKFANGVLTSAAYTTDGKAYPMKY